MLDLLTVISSYDVKAQVCCKHCCYKIPPPTLLLIKKLPDSKGF